MTTQANPFALVKASDFTDQQINELWVELGQLAVQTIIEPTSIGSKFILGGKGTGKTHLLRYYSYPAASLRAKNTPGLKVITDSKFLAIFLRATGLDAARFEASGATKLMWQQLFGVYLELRLVEGVLDALADVVATSPNEMFDHLAFIEGVQSCLVGAELHECLDIVDLRKWVLDQKRIIDDAINNSAFSGQLNIRIPFSIGAFAIPIARFLSRLHPKLDQIPLIYLIDEIENFSESQQQVVNSLIRYGEGLATFRVTGRLYSRKTRATLADGEENVEHSEFKTENLDDILRSYPKYAEFSEKFVKKRLLLSGKSVSALGEKFRPAACFQEIDQSSFYSKSILELGVADGAAVAVKSFSELLRLALKNSGTEELVMQITRTLTNGLPELIQKLNVVLFLKKFTKQADMTSLSEKIRQAAEEFMSAPGVAKGWYATAYGHYSVDLFAQTCRDSRRAIGVPYAGFDVFTRMSWGNPRNLLIVLGRAYEIAQFREIDFINGEPLSIQFQTQAAIAAARFTFEEDSNYGRQSDLAREAVRRLAELLRAARFSLRIPEVSPLTVTFSQSDLSAVAKETLNYSLNYSLVYEVYDGRPDRNTKALNRKIQLNPILSPRWGLPVVRRGDISLNRELLEAIFSQSSSTQFDTLLRTLSTKWNGLTRSTGSHAQQKALF